MNPFVKDSPEVWRGVLDAVPDEFQDFLTEPAFEIEAATFCFWRRYSDSFWHVGNIDYPEGDDPDGSEDLLSILDGKPETYQNFAAEYFEKEISLSVIEYIYEQWILTEEIISELNTEVSKYELRDDIEEISYPNDAI